MKKVKVLMCEDFYSEYDTTVKVLTDGITEWETITDEDYNFLRNNLYKMSNMFIKDKGLNSYAVVVCQDDMPVQERIKSLTEIIKLEKEHIKAETKKREDLLEAKRLKREEKLSKQKALSEKAEKELFEKLKIKYTS